MNLLKSLIEKPILRALQPPAIHAIVAGLGRYSQFGVVLTVIWFVMNRPFWRYGLIALSAMAFAPVLLPAEMMFLVRHPVLVFAVPFVVGFVRSNLGTSQIGTVAACAALVALAVASYRSVEADPVTGLWLRSRVEIAVPFILPVGFGERVDAEQCQRRPYVVFKKLEHPDNGGVAPSRECGALHAP